MRAALGPVDAGAHQRAAGVDRRGVEAEAVDEVAAGRRARRRRRGGPARRARPAGRRARRPPGPRGGRSTSAPRASACLRLTAVRPIGRSASGGPMFASASSASATCGPARLASRLRPLATIVISPARSSLLQVAGDGRRRDADPHGQRTRRQRRPAQQLLEHARAGPVGERGGDVSDLGHVVQARPWTLRRTPKRRALIVGPMLLAAPVPDPGPAGPYGTMAWLRATVSRFANDETHARRRALVEALLAEIDPAELREEAAAMARERQLVRAQPEQLCVRGIERRICPSRCSLAASVRADLAAAVAATRVVAAAYQPHTSHPDSDDALAGLLSPAPRRRRGARRRAGRDPRAGLRGDGRARPGGRCARARHPPRRPRR